MTAGTLKEHSTHPSDLLFLQHGDRLTREEFERRWEAMPELKKAEPGLDTPINSTLRLQGDNDPQPDEALFIKREFGGSVWLDAKGYMHGVPELVAEVSASSVSYDLHRKLNVYQAAGISEYVVHRVVDRAIDWFALQDGVYTPSAPAADGLLRSRVFPGLWLDPTALARRDMTRVFAVLNAGLASPEHAVFVEQLRKAATNATQPPTP